jgi:hypothetical protein
VVAAFCRAHHGGILTAAGRWNEAETELIEATRHFDQGMSGRREAAIIGAGQSLIAPRPAMGRRAVRCAKLS